VVDLRCKVDTTYAKYIGRIGASIVYGVIHDGGLSAVALPVVVTVLPDDLPVVTTSVLGDPLYSNNVAPKVVDPFVTISDNSTSLKRAVITVAGGLLGGNTHSRSTFLL
jgi:hypothetical protein